MSCVESSNSILFRSFAHMGAKFSARRPIWECQCLLTSIIWLHGKFWTFPILFAPQFYRGNVSSETRSHNKPARGWAYKFANQRNCWVTHVFPGLLDDDGEGVLFQTVEQSIPLPDV